MAARNTARFNMVLPQWLKEAGQQVADELGMSFAEYVKDLIKRDVERRKIMMQPDKTTRDQQETTL